MASGEAEFAIQQKPELSRLKGWKSLGLFPVRTQSACCARPERPRGGAADEADERAALCMTEKEHAEGRRGLGHDRFPVATGSPQALRLSHRE